MVLALVVNALADYLSLLETRWLLGWLARHRPVWLQALVLLGDLAVTAAIIWGALWAVQATGLTAFVLGEGRDGLAEVVGLFSPLAVFFYSSFVTSIWTWGFILSSWLMRGLARQHRLHGVYAEHPGKALSAALGATALVTGFAGSAAFAALTAPDAQGLSPFDRALCRFAKGEVCLHIRSLTTDEATRLALTLDACRGGITTECLRRANDIYEQDVALAAQYWRTACETGEALGCTELGILHQKGIGMDPNLGEAARLYQQGCDTGDEHGCTILGFLHQQGIGMEPDPAEAARFFWQGCNGGNAVGCTDLGVLLENGIVMEPDPDPAVVARLYRQGCDGGDARGCNNLGFLHEMGIGVERNPVAAARLYRQGCDGGHALGCTNLGFLHAQGIGMEPDPKAATGLFAQACAMGEALGYDFYARHMEYGIGTASDPTAARAAYRKACDLGQEGACARLTTPIE